MTRILVLMLVFIFSTLSQAQEKPAAKFLAGFAERDITPEIGMEAPGGYGKSYHQSIHDPCKVRAAVFDDGNKVAAIVGIDALGIRRDTVLKVRAAIQEKTGIPGDNIMIGASHSHSSGPIVWIMPDEFDHASALVQKLAYEQSTCVDLKYLAMVEAALIDAVCAAHEKRVASKAGIGKGIEDQVAFNRRFRMRDGRTVSHPGLGNPEIVEPAGPVDPEVGVIGAWDEKDDNKLLGCVVNFCCHATTNPQSGGISANYVYYLEKVIQGYYGKDCVVVFVNGASGDVTQVNNQNPFQHPAPDRWAQFVGARVGAEALKVLTTIEPGQLTPIDARSKTWEIKRRPPAAEKVKKALEIVEANDPNVDSTVKTFAKETLMLDALLKTQPSATVEVQAIQVGPAVFVSDPAEYFCRYGLEIKAGTEFPFTFPVSLANGCVGYVPTRESFDADGGGYETRLTSYSNLEITAGDQMRDVGIALARELKPGLVPMPAKRVPFTGAPWSYGNVPPELD
jgi:neutral ceramidase